MESKDEEYVCIIIYACCLSLLKLSFKQKSPCRSLCHGLKQEVLKNNATCSILI